MTERPIGVCSICHLLKDLRPAGPNGEEVCLMCAKLDKDALAAYAHRTHGMVPPREEP